MSEVKINPDLLIILVGSVINKSISDYDQPLKDCRAYLPADEFLKNLNDTTLEYTLKFPNNDINFPPIDIKLLSFIIKKTLFYKFVNVTNDHVIVEILPNGYENILKNIVATSTLRYAKFLLHTANELYKIRKSSDIESTKEISPPLKDESDHEKSKQEKLETLLEESRKPINDVPEDIQEKEIHEDIREEESPALEIEEQSSESEKETKEVDMELNKEQVSDKLQEEGEDAESKEQEGKKEKPKEVTPEEQIELEPKEDDTREQPEEQEKFEKDQIDKKHLEAQIDKEKAEKTPVELDSESKDEVEEKQSKEQPENIELITTKAEENIKEETPETTTIPQKLPTPKESRKRSKSPAPHLKYKRFQNIAINLLNTISEHRFSSPFLQAVNEKDAPNYYDIILQPKDLKTILKAIKSKTDDPQYTKIKQLEKDIMLMFSNCVMYNRSDDELVKLTRTMKDEINEILKMFKEAEEEIK